MKRKEFMMIVGVTLLLVGISFGSSAKQRPNIVVVFTDDQGYGDVGVYGAEGFTTPNIDAMAGDGMMFTDFYVASSVCSPSRAGLLTGCYPQRVGIPNVLFPEKTNDVWDATEQKTKTGIHQDEITIAEMLKEAGYATACFGKWHLGHHKQFLPLQQGFDEYFGLPYSNDMRPEKSPNKRFYPKLPLIKDNEVFRYMEEDQSMLTTEYTEHAIDFIKRKRDEPFFIYLAHSMPHIPLYASSKFKGKSERGIYGDVISEIDWSVGEINRTLKELGLEENTLVIFTCDNGPWLMFGDHGGSAGELREGKFTTFEGGQRVPCIMKWPKKIPSGVTCNELATTLDLLPTFSKISGAELPKNKIDGENIYPLITGKSGAVSPTEAFYYYIGWNLDAVRSGKWKLHLPHGYKAIVEDNENGNAYGRKGVAQKISLSLYDLSKDVAEQHNVVDEHPEVVEELMKYVEKMRADLGDGDSSGSGRRDSGWQRKNSPLFRN